MRSSAAGCPTSGRFRQKWGFLRSSTAALGVNARWGRLSYFEMDMSHGYDERPTDELIRLYEKAAAEHSQANRRGDFKAGNPAADRVAAIYKVIRSRGLDHQRMLLPLLLSSDKGVRGWAAAHALEFEPRQAEAVLSELAKLEGLEGFSAKMTLKTWREGSFRFQ